MKGLASIAKSAENFNQKQVHVRQDTESQVGTAFADGSYATPVYRWELTVAMDRKQIQAVIDQSGLYGLTFGEDFVEAYFVNQDGAKDDAGKEITHDQQRSNFDAAIQSADRIMGSSAKGARRSIARLWPHGRGDGGIGWGRVDSNDSTGQADVRRSERVKRVFRSGQGDGGGTRLHLANGQEVVGLRSFNLDQSEARNLNQFGTATPELHELDAGIHVEDFARSISGSKIGNKHSSSVNVYSKDEYAGMRLFMANGGKTGFALNSEGSA